MYNMMPTEPSTFTYIKKPEKAITFIETTLCTPKCDRCLHKEICSKKTIYINTCQNIKNILGGAAQDFISVLVSCKHFLCLKEDINDDNQ